MRHQKKKKSMEKIILENPDTLKIPEAVMIRPKIVAVFDNIKDTINIMTSVYPKKEVDAETAFNQGNKRISNVVTQLNTDVAKNLTNNKFLSHQNIHFQIYLE